LYVATWGGAYENTLKEVSPSFEREFNCKVITVGKPSSEDILVVAREGEVDIVHFDIGTAMRAEKEGLLLDLDPSLIPNFNDLYDIAKLTSKSVVSNVGAYVLCWNAKFIGPGTPYPEPTSWLDLWKPEYSGKVVMRDITYVGTVELLVLMAKLGGGDERHIDPGFEKFKELKVRAYVTSHEEEFGVFQREEAWIGQWTSGRVYWAQTKGLSLNWTIPKEGAFAMVTVIGVTKGAEARGNKELAMRYINFLLGPEVQSAFAEKLAYAPTNKKVVVRPELAAQMPYGEEQMSKLIISDWGYIITVWEDWVERWQKEIA
jgi:putative spermidine/putrescine transport system substrate-binding protein